MASVTPGPNSAVTRNGSCRDHRVSSPPWFSRLKEYTLASRPRTKSAATRQILVHPGGGKLLVLTDSALFFVERIGEE